MTTPATSPSTATRASLLPDAGRLPAALAAGLVWLPTMAWLTTVPARVRDAHLDRLVTGEGLVFAWLTLTLVAIGGLLGLASWLSVLGHGDRHTAARAVVVVRIVSWSAYLLLLAGAGWVEGTWDRECWRTCAPFPR